MCSNDREHRKIVHVYLDPVYHGVHSINFIPSIHLSPMILVKLLCDYFHQYYWHISDTYQENISRYWRPLINENFHELCMFPLQKLFLVPMVVHFLNYGLISVFLSRTIYGIPPPLGIIASIGLVGIWSRVFSFIRSSKTFINIFHHLNLFLKINWCPDRLQIEILLYQYRLIFLSIWNQM